MQQQVQPSFVASHSVIHSSDSEAVFQDCHQRGQRRHTRINTHTHVNTDTHVCACCFTDSLRAEAQFRREYDGHVWVRARSGDWWEVSRLWCVFLNMRTTYACWSLPASASCLYSCLFTCSLLAGVHVSTRQVAPDNPVLSPLVSFSLAAPIIGPFLSMRKFELKFWRRCIKFRLRMRLSTSVVYEV